MTEKALPTVEEMVDNPLWKINEAVRDLLMEIQDWIEEHEDDPAGELPPHLDERWAALAEAKPAKVDRCAQALSAFKYNIERLKAEKKMRMEILIEPVNALLKAHEGLEARYKEYLIRQIENEGEKKLEGNEARIRVQATAGRTEVTDIKLVPDRFKTVVMEIPRDKYVNLRKFIRAHLSEDAADKLKEYVVDEKVDKKAAKEALGEPEFMAGVPGIEFTPGKSLRVF